MDDIKIISEGNEIMFAKVLADLFMFGCGDDTFFSSMGKRINVEMFSTQVYLHSNVPQNSFRVIIGKAVVDTPDMQLVYSNSGMKYYSKNNFAKLFVEQKDILSNYDDVYLDLIKNEEKFFEIESDYVKRCGWEKSIYVEQESSLLSKRSSKKRIVQAYNCLAYYFYLHKLSQM